MTSFFDADFDPQAPIFFLDHAAICYRMSKASESKSLVLALSRYDVQSFVYDAVRWPQNVDVLFETIQKTNTVDARKEFKVDSYQRNSIC